MTTVAKPVGTRHRRRPPRVAVILAGGQGTRFWPRGRRRLPKQLLTLFGSRSLLRETADRLRRLVPWERMIVVTTRAHAAAVRQQVPELPAAHVLVEPEGRNTLPCLLLALRWVEQNLGEATLVVSPADHRVADAAALASTLRRAAEAAEQAPDLVVVGVRPTRPETGFGYIEPSGPVEFGAGGGVVPVRRFREKPNLRDAREFLRRGHFLWNTGIFVGCASTFRAAAEHCMPGWLSALTDALGRRSPSGRPSAALQRWYASVPAVSVDVGLLEPLSLRQDGPGLAVVPAAFEWSDVGSWDALPEVLPSDAAGNAALGDLLAVDSEGCLTVAPQRLVALLGVRDLVVIDSPDAILVCQKGRGQDVRQVVAEIERRGWFHLL